MSPSHSNRTSCSSSFHLFVHLGRRFSDRANIGLNFEHVTSFNLLFCDPLSIRVYFYQSVCLFAAITMDIHVLCLGSQRSAVQQLYPVSLIYGPTHQACALPPWATRTSLSRILVKSAIMRPLSSILHLMDLEDTMNLTWACATSNQGRWSFLPFVPSCLPAKYRRCSPPLNFTHFIPTQTSSSHNSPYIAYSHCIILFSSSIG